MSNLRAGDTVTLNGKLFEWESTQWDSTSPNGGEIAC
jgi:hypothetical protein